MDNLTQQGKTKMVTLRAHYQGLTMGFSETVRLLNPDQEELAAEKVRIIKQLVTAKVYFYGDKPVLGADDFLPSD